ncbi:hypothetical protein [Nocardioides plantarum]|uniref:ABC transporter permease n=1 Tax=Nocardioides plantarum TaxID=29299 RepID=A0ABV5K4M5_9ACTN|nr:hypothetical protein [Nocardioides plantarum]
MQANAIARASIQELLRRRGALIMLIALPLAFYLARRDIPSSAIVVLALGVGWAVATLALFNTVNSLKLDRRLRVAGFTARAILAGRLLAVLLFGLVLSFAYLLLALLDQEVARPGGVALMMMCAVVVGAPLGMAVGLLLRSELEGALALLIFLATQFMTNPDRLLAHLLPLWSVRGVADWAVWSADSGKLIAGLAHGATTVTVLITIITGASAFRLRVHPPHAVLRERTQSPTDTATNRGRVE